MQQERAVADGTRAMSSPRNIYPDTTLYVTCRAVHRSFRLVPTKRVRRILEYVFAVVSDKYRRTWGMEFYEFEFLSNHYHLVVYDRFGKITDFLQELNALVARELNALRGTSGSVFARDPGIQTVLGEQRVLAHAVYTLANAVAAGIVTKTRHWKGLNSFRMEYGREYVIKKPKLGMWSEKQRHKSRQGSRRSGRAKFASRSKMPDTAILKLDRPRLMPELSDAELRAKVRADLEVREAELHVKRAGKPVLGMKAAEKVHWSTVPRQGEELFTRRPTFSTQTAEQRRRMKQLRREFLQEYREALDRWNAGQRDVVFPAGTVRMRLRHKVPTEPIPLDLLLAA